MPQTHQTAHGLVELEKYLTEDNKKENEQIPFCASFSVS